MSLTFGLCPVNNSIGVLLIWFAVDKHLFLMYAAVFTALPHHLLSSPDPFNSALTMSNRVLQVRSATPFCSGVLGIVYSLLILLSMQYCLNSLEVYSPPLSDLNFRTCSSSG